jgi:hypothetical protein
MLKGGVIMDVTTPEEARIAEEAGAVAVMALERVPADIRRDGGVARMSDPAVIKAIKAAVTIPVMAKARIGHFVEAQILESLGVDYVDESEVRREKRKGGRKREKWREENKKKNRTPLFSPPFSFHHLSTFLPSGPHPRRRRPPHQQAHLPCPLRLRLPGLG